MSNHSKQSRQGLILEILKADPDRTQTGLQKELARRGVRASQITISRDLRDLGVARLSGKGYALPGQAVADPGRLGRVLREHVRSMEAAGQFIVIKTPPSGAQPVGLALDQAGIEEIAGTIAGDDTVFVLLKKPAFATRVLARLRAAS